jgi:hypothetical protein
MRVLPVKKMRWLGTGLVVAATFAVGLQWLRQKPGPLPEVQITTVARIKTTNTWSPKGKVGMSYPLGMSDSWYRLRPCTVDSQGSITIVDDSGNIVTSSDNGTVVRRMPCPWIDRAFFIQGDVSQNFWVGQYYDVTNVSRWSVVKVRRDGKPLWRIGEYRILAVSSDGYRSHHWKSAGETVANKDLDKYSVPRAPKKAIDDDHFIEMCGLIESGKNIYVLTYDFMVRKYGPEGQLTERYNLKNATHAKKGLAAHNFSMIAAPGGGFYAGQLEFLSRSRITGLRVTGIQVNHWTNPNSYSSRVVDLTGLGRVPPHGVRLAGVDGKGRLYLQYNFDREGAPLRDPAAVAVVGEDNRAVKIFDILEHYQDEIDAARKRTVQRRGETIINVGEIVKVAANGDFYLEIATPGRYRIDKISFAKESGAL